MLLDSVFCLRLRPRKMRAKVRKEDGLVEYVCVDYRFQKSLFHDPPKFRLMRVVELQAVSHREDTGKRGTW